MDTLTKIFTITGLFVVLFMAVFAYAIVLHPDIPYGWHAWGIVWIIILIACLDVKNAEDESDE